MVDYLAVNQQRRFFSLHPNSFKYIITYCLSLVMAQKPFSNNIPNKDGKTQTTTRAMMSLK